MRSFFGYWLAILFTLLLNNSVVEAQYFYDFHPTKLTFTSNARAVDFAMRPGGRPALSYYSPSPGRINYAELTNGNWVSEQTGTVSFQPLFTTLFFINNEPHIFFYDASSRALIHRTKHEGIWIENVIDDGSGQIIVGTVKSCSNQICICYFDNEYHLKFKSGQPGSWDDQLVSNSTSYSNCDFALDSNNNPVLISYDTVNLKPTVFYFNDDSWSSEMLTFQTYNFGNSPTIAVAQDGTIFIASAQSPDGSELYNTYYYSALYRSTKPPGEPWTHVQVTDKYAFSPKNMELNSSGNPGFVYYTSTPNCFLCSPGSGISYYQYNGTNWIGNSIFWDRSVNVQGWGTAHDSFGKPVAIYVLWNSGLFEPYYAPPTDNDHDQIPDVLEESLGLSYSETDFDNDNLADGEELLTLGTNPRSSDTDSDGQNDDVDPQPLSTINSNLVSDGNMEKKILDDWIPLDNPLIFTKTSADRIEGETALLLKTSDSSSAILQKSITSSQNTRYLLSVRYKRQSGELTIGLGWGSSVNDFETSEFSNDVNSGWQKHLRYFTTPASAGDLRLFIRTTGEVLIDDIAIVAASSGSNIDGDDYEDQDDNCLAVANSDQVDSDGDGYGDACDIDNDNDGIPDSADCAPFDATKWRNQAFLDADHDNVRDNTTLQTVTCFGNTVESGYTNEVTALDNCPNVANANQANVDYDTDGDACDNDMDGDNVANNLDCAPQDSGAFEMLPVYRDQDNDGLIDSAIAENKCASPYGAPAGYILNSTAVDNCPNDANWDQADADNDSLGDVCDPYPNDPNNGQSSSSSSGSSSSAPSNLDSDNDGVSDYQEGIDQSNAQDPGSKYYRLQSPVYALWDNKDGVKTELELFNKGNTDISVLMVVYDNTGTKLYQIRKIVEATLKVTLKLSSINALKDKKGHLKLTYSGTNIDGKTLYYVSTGNNEIRVEAGLAPSIKGTSAVIYNISNAQTPQYSSFENKLVILNLSTSVQNFGLTRYDTNGTYKRYQTVSVPALQSVTIENKSLKIAPGEQGSYKIKPLNPTQPYLAQLRRYGGTLSTNRNMFLANYSKIGIGQPISTDFSNNSLGEKWLEIANTTSLSQTPYVKFYDSAGNLKANLKLNLLAFDHAALRVGKYLSTFGMIKVVPSASNSIIANFTTYNLTSTNKLNATSSSYLREPIEPTINACLDQAISTKQWLVLSNPSNTWSRYSFTVYTKNGKVIQRSATIDPRKSRTFALHSSTILGETSPTTAVVSVSNSSFPPVASINSLTSITPLR